MGAAERTEDVLKRIHVLFSKAEPELIVIFPNPPLNIAPPAFAVLPI